jgi:sterol desaturase/sphingolipid hydroxylase (fatty acid hydroxylase superfamily)
VHAFLLVLAQAYGRVALTAGRTFFDAGSNFSLPSLASAGLLALGFTAISRRRRGRRLRWRTLRVALGPGRRILEPSGKADVGFFLFNTFSAGGLIGWALLSQKAVSDETALILLHLTGRHGAAPVPSSAAAAILTLATFLAYEAAYWFDHWLSHSVPCLWEIHKVHHTAEALSPLTNFRVHPLESLKFYNIVALATGAAAGVVQYALGARTGLRLFGADAAVVAFMFTLAHLQHSHLWIATRGVAGRLIISPAHHQIHHSSDPRHFGRNLGSALAVFDWMFGTLYIPAARREPLRFGVAGEGAAAHTVTGSLLTPMRRAAAALASWRSAAEAVLPQDELVVAPGSDRERVASDLSEAVGLIQPLRLQVARPDAQPQRA